MKTLSLIAILLATTGLHAQVLGELQGQGQIEVSTQVNGQTTHYSNACQIAINLDWTSANLNLDFSVFTCGLLDTWNDNSYNMTIVGNQLMNNGIQIGQIDQTKGLAQFKTEWTVTEKVHVTTYDQNCQPSFDQVVTMTLAHSVEYQFRKLNNGYEFVRKELAEDVKNIFAKPYPTCRAEPVSVKAQVVRELKGSVAAP